jgi:uncharacterized membrane protein
MTRWSFSPKRIFLAGLLVMLPAVVAGYVLYAVFDTFDGLLQPVVQRAFHRQIPGVGFVALASVIFLLGLVASNLLGARAVRAFSRWLERIPLYSPVYRAMRDISEVFLGDRSSAFRRAGLLEWPSRGSWAVVFVMAENVGPFRAALGEDLVTVFLPTSPNPTTGFVLLVPRASVLGVDMSVEQAIKIVISGGAVLGQGSGAGRPSGAV